MSTRKALAFSFLDRYAGLILTVVSSMIIARVLSPSEIGVFSVAMVLVGFVSAIRDMGAGTYLVQERELTTERIRAVWTVQLGMGITLGLAVLIAAAPVAHFYHQAALVDIMLLLALNFVVTPFGSLTYAWLMREMSFGKLAVMRFTGSLTSTLVSVALALANFGPVSLAWGSLAATIANALVAVAFRPPHFPWMPIGFSEIRRVISFGSRISATSITNGVVYGSPELLLGKFQDMTTVGLYSRSNGLITMFNKLVMDAVQSVAISVFAQESRAGKDCSDGFIRATAYITVLAWVFFGILALFPIPILRLLYGPQWDSAAPVLQLMAIGMAIGIPGGLCSTVMVALGDAARVLRTSIHAGIVYISIMACGAALGLFSIGLSFIAVNIICVVIFLSNARSVVGFKWLQLIRGLLPSASVAIASLSPSFFIILVFDVSNRSTWGLLVGSGLSLPLFLWGCYYFKHPISTELDRMRLILTEKLL